MNVDVIFDSKVFMVERRRDKGVRTSYRVLLKSYGFDRREIDITSVREVCGRVGLHGIAHGFQAHRFTSRKKALAAVTAATLML